jgi:small subunit ribosomal protein S6
VLRHLIMLRDDAVTTPSPMMKEEKSRSLMEGGTESAAPAPAPAAAEAPAAA